MALQPSQAAWRLACLIAGAGMVTTFAPFGLWWLAPLPLAVLFGAWLRTPGSRHRAVLGLAWGLGLFTCGVHWIYISLHDHGGMPAPIALIALLGFSAFCALIPAAAGALSAKVRATPLREALLVMPAAFVLLEWTRTWFCTGFPWLATGYSQVSTSPLAQWLPIGGVYAASLAVALLAGALALAWQTWGVRQGQRTAVAVVLGVLLLATGPALVPVAWTHATGAPLTVALLQGNVAQDDKFAEGPLQASLQRYLDLAIASRARLIVLPESALPLLREDLPDGLLDAFAAVGRRNHGDVLVGLFDAPAPGEIHNSMLSVGSAPSRLYYKHHLVPFGEFIPLQGLVAPVMNALLRMPLGSQAAGPAGQGTLALAGQRVAVDICYEDAFGEEIITALPAATLLVNVSNDAWFGQRVGPEQHLQMARARSLETGRAMLRATNTGVTALIAADGSVQARAPMGTVSTLEGVVQGREGITPFVRWGNLPVVLLCAGLLAWVRLRHNARTA